MIYKTYISTKVKDIDLRFRVQYSANSEKEAVKLAQAEWPFPEYYMIAAVLLKPEDIGF